LAHRPPGVHNSIEMADKDSELLEEFARRKSDAAFARIVERFSKIVFVAARRQVGDPYLAEDVTQAVFIVLARKARSVPKNSLAGWLIKTTRLCALDAIKMQARRRHYEREAAMMKSEIASPSEAPDPQILAALDEAMAKLRSRDCTALVLRFMQDRPVNEVAAALAISPNAAQKVVARSLAKLKKNLGRRGVIVPSTALLSAAMLHESAQPAPASLVVSLSSATARGVSIGKGVSHMMFWAKMKIAVATVATMIFLLGTGSFVVVRALADASNRAGTTSGMNSPAGDVATTAPGTMPTKGYTPVTAQQQPTSDIGGLVSDESGRPVPGVRVNAVLGWDANASRRSTISDAAGRFAFRNLAPSGYWFFSVNDPRYAWEWDHERGIDVPANPETLPLPIAIFKPRTLRGTVVDDTGTTVAGARVVLVNEMLPGQSMPINGHLDTDFIVARSNAAGEFTMSRLRPGTTVFWLDCPGYAHALTTLKIAGDAQQSLRISRGLTLRGRVVHDGQGVAGVALVAGYSEAIRPMLDWRGKSGPDGRFEITNIPIRPREEWPDVPATGISVADRAWYGDRVDVYQTTEASLPNVTIEVNPREPGNTPEVGRVDVGKRDEPLQGTVRVTLPGLVGQPMVSVQYQTKPATTNPVVFNGIPAGRARVMVFTGTSGDAARRPKIIQVGAGQTTDVVMEPGPCRLQGTVRSGGAVIGEAGQYVSWFAYPPGLLGTYQGCTLVKPDGSYSIDGLTPGDYQVVYQSSDSMVNSFVSHLPAAGSTVLDLDLPAGKINGRMIGVTPTPSRIPGIGTIQVWPLGFPPRIPPNTGCMVSPDATGRFTVEHLQPGWYSVTGYGLHDTVDIDREGAVVMATLKPPENTGEIAGAIDGLLPASIEGPLGESDINVLAFPKEHEGYNFYVFDYRGPVDAKSRTYHIRNLPAGTYGVLVMGELAVASSTPLAWIPDVEVRPGMSRQLPITMVERRTVDVIPVDRQKTGQPIPTCAGWRLLMPTGDWLSGRMLTGGLCLPLGQYTIEAQYGLGGAIVSQQFTIIRGEATQKIELNAPK
jgi:RNA polymerase sigma factor (sigma-70 family)